MIHFACTTCRKRFQVADEFGGRRVKCPKCATVLKVPQSLVEHMAGQEAARDLPLYDHEEEGTHLFPHRHE